jgi:hypothetical protein
LLEGFLPPEMVRLVIEIEQYQDGLLGRGA